MNNGESVGRDRIGIVPSAEPVKKRSLMSPPAKPERTSLPRLSLTYQEVDRLFDTVAESAVAVRVRLFWRDASVYESESLTSTAELNVANPADVGTLFIGAEYEDESKLDLTLSFAEDSPCIEVYHGRRARTVAMKIVRDYRDLRRGPSWPWRLRSTVLRPGHFTIYASALSAFITITVGLVLFAVGDEQFDAGWMDLALSGLSFVVFILICTRVDRYKWFQLLPNEKRVAANWEVRWAAAGAIVGTAGFVVALISLLVR